MRALKKLSLAGVASLPPAAAFAHPGPHRDDAVWSLLHILTNPDHWLVIGAGVAIAFGSAALVALRPQR